MDKSLELALEISSQFGRLLSTVESLQSLVSKLPSAKELELIAARIEGQRTVVEQLSEKETTILEKLSVTSSSHEKLVEAMTEVKSTILDLTKLYQARSEEDKIILEVAKKFQHPVFDSEEHKGHLDRVRTMKEWVDIIRQRKYAAEDYDEAGEFIQNIKVIADFVGMLKSKWAIFVGIIALIIAGVTFWDSLIKIGAGVARVTTGGP